VDSLEAQAFAFLAVRSLRGLPMTTLVRRKTVSHITAMNTPSAFSKVSVKSQTVIPRAVRKRLGLKPGDRLRYRLTENGVLLDKAPLNETEDPFASFSEWSSEADEAAYGDL
jgi:antitoxin PrlF